MFSLRPSGIPLVAMVLVLAVRTGHSAETIRLTRWEERATLISHHAPGVSFFHLVAQTSALRDRPADASFNLRVELPGGQVETRPIPDAELSARRLTVLVRAAAVLNLRPADVKVRASVVDNATGATISNALTATIDEFPRPTPSTAASDPGPFGWGEPLAPDTEKAQLLPRPGPDGLSFVRVPATEGENRFYLAVTEASNAQVAKRLAGYDPRAGRSDEFTLEDPAQPALGLTPRRARDFLAELGKADSAGLTYRLPRVSEWLRAARAGSTTAFWWGDEPTHPAGANFLGPEPTLPGDTTAPAQPPGTEGPGSFTPNRWGLYHTFGNIAEWAENPVGGLLRLGGHFRTEPAAPLPNVLVENAESMGPDLYVGVRPAFDLNAETGAELVRKALHGNQLLADVEVAYDPDRATATLSGHLPEASLRRAADRRLEPLWFLAAVENRIDTPTFAPGQLAELGPVAGKIRRITPLGRWIYVVPISAHWGDPLPVRGSEWWVNVYMHAHGDHGTYSYDAYKLVEREPSDTPTIDVLISRDKMAAVGLPPDAPVLVALSLGAAAPTPHDPHVVSNVVTLIWSLH